MQGEQPDTQISQACFVMVALVAGILTGIFGGLFHLIIESLIELTCPGISYQ